MRLHVKLFILLSLLYVNMSHAGRFFEWNKFSQLTTVFDVVANHISTAKGPRQDGCPVSAQPEEILEWMNYYAGVGDGMSSVVLDKDILDADLHRNGLTLCRSTDGHPWIFSDQNLAAAIALLEIHHIEARLQSWGVWPEVANAAVVAGGAAAAAAVPVDDDSYVNQDDSESVATDMDTDDDEQRKNNILDWKGDRSLSLLFDIVAKHISIVKGPSSAGRLSATSKEILDWMKKYVGLDCDANFKLDKKLLYGELSDAGVTDKKRLAAIIAEKVTLPKIKSHLQKRRLFANTLKSNCWPGL